LYRRGAKQVVVGVLGHTLVRWPLDDLLSNVDADDPILLLTVPTNIGVAGQYHGHSPFSRRWAGGLSQPKQEDAQEQNNEGQKRKQQRVCSEECAFYGGVDQLPPPMDTIAKLAKHGLKPPAPIRAAEIPLLF
jgi:hypothetical protein